METPRLRAWMKKYGDAGVLMVAAYIGLQFLWGRRLVLSCILALGVLGLLFSTHCPHSQTRGTVATSPPAATVRPAPEAVMTHEQDDQRSRQASHGQVNDIKRELEHQGVTVVTGEDGQSYGLVASVPDSQFSYCAGSLDEAGIASFGSCSRGLCGAYVPVEALYHAAQLLRDKIGSGEWVEVWSPIDSYHEIR